MNKLKRVGGEFNYSLYNEQDENVGFIDKSAAADIEQDVDPTILVTLPCGWRIRFWNLTHTDEQYIYAANYFKDENAIAKED
jgi:hypothetical protein